MHVKHSFVRQRRCSMIHDAHHGFGSSTVTPVIYGKLTYARVKLIGTAITSVVLHHKPIILLI